MWCEVFALRKCTLMRHIPQVWCGSATWLFHEHQTTTTVNTKQKLPKNRNRKSGRSFRNCFLFRSLFALFFLNEIRFLTHTIFFGVHQPKINLSRLRTFQLHLSCLEERRTFLRDSSATEEILGTSKKKSKSSSCFKNRWLNFRTGNFRSFPDTSRCLVETRPLDSGIDPSMAKRSQPTSPGWKKDTWKTKGWRSNQSQSVKKPENLGQNTLELTGIYPYIPVDVAVLTGRNM